MSFSNQVKQELVRELPDKECCRRAELAALVHVNGQVIPMDGERLKLVVRAEQAGTARKIYTLIKSLYGLETTAHSKTLRRFKKTRIYEVHAIINKDAELWKKLQGFSTSSTRKRYLTANLIRRHCCKRAYLRGMFLSKGFINRPEGEYHLEIIFQELALAKEVQRLLTKFNLSSRIVERKRNLVLYIKEGEKIVDFLRVVGAHKALLDFENVRILKSMRNSINRQVNCETANLAKTIDASVRQIQLINQLVELKGWEFLPAQLRDLARARIEYPDKSLKELGDLLDPPLSKSGAAYRMRKLEKWAEEIIDFS
ncbi:MAG: DNA-binding protein WhiA [Syntrophomonadaceae bacterium]|jgi:DNA-binding protein WhiA|nr:DNA-binding protein WhiA [Syntrophomonadaceae bacterium]